MKPVKLSLLLLLFCSCLGLGAMAQTEFTLNAVLFEKNTKTRLNDAIIFNKRNRYTTGSNNMGLFQLKVAVGDTLLITKRDYNDVTLTVGAAKDMVIYLSRSANMLNEIVVNKTRVIDEIKNDHKNGVPTGKVSPWAFIFSPVSAFYGLFSTEGKNKRRFNRYYHNELQQSHIDAFFNKSIVSSHTGLTGRALEDFMANYRPDYEQSKNWTTYDGLKWIKDSYKKYSDTARRAN